MNHTIKYWLFFSIGIFLLLQSCNDDKSPVYEFTAAPELSPLDNSSLVLNEEAENFIAETFSWSAGKYGFQAAPLYTLQIDNTESFSDPISLAETHNLYLPVNVGKLNMATLILGGESGIPLETYVRLKSELTSNIIVYSGYVTLEITPYPMVIVYPKLYVPGSYQGWNIANAPTLLSYRMNNKYEGYLNLVDENNPDAPITFKLTTEPVWNKGEEYGSGGAPGTLALKGGDISISPQKCRSQYANLYFDSGNPGRRNDNDRQITYILGGDEMYKPKELLTTPISCRCSSFFISKNSSFYLIL